MSDSGTDRIQVRIQPELKIAFQAWCKIHKTTASDFFRREIQAALSRDDKAKIRQLEKEIRELKDEVRRLKNG